MGAVLAAGELHRLRGLHGRAEAGQEAAWLRGHWPQILQSRCYRILHYDLLCFTQHKAAHQTKHFCSVCSSDGYLQVYKWIRTVFTCSKMCRVLHSTNMIFRTSEHLTAELFNLQYCCKRLIGEVVQSRRRPLLVKRQKS